MMQLLVTNDFPPKLGGIQTYLWELWRRLPVPAVLTASSHPEARAFDAAQPFRVERMPAKVLWPSKALARRIDAMLSDDASTGGPWFIDPLLPTGLVVPRVHRRPVFAIVHGAEVTTPGRVPGGRAVVRRVLHSVDGIVAAGGYPAQIAHEIATREIPTTIVPPGVDVERFQPSDESTRATTRRRFGLPVDAALVVGISRLVPRKGFDVVIDAVARLRDVHLAIGGDGRDRARLERRARAAGIAHRVHFLGRIANDDLSAVYGCADVFAMACRDRWGGLEAEGFGIVFLEAQACGVPAVAGRSGGSHEAVADGETGFVIDPQSVDAVADAIGRLLEDDERRAAMGRAAREWAVMNFAWDVLAERLAAVST